MISRSQKIDDIALTEDSGVGKALAGLQEELADELQFPDEIYFIETDLEQVPWLVWPMMSTAAGICTGAAAQKCTTGSVVACPHSPWEGPARGATRPPRGWRRPARERGVWAHAGKRGVIRTVAGVVTGSA